MAKAAELPEETAVAYGSLIKERFDGEIGKGIAGIRAGTRARRTT